MTGQTYGFVDINNQHAKVIYPADYEDIIVTNRKSHNVIYLRDPNEGGQPLLIFAQKNGKSNTEITAVLTYTPDQE